MLDSLVRVSRRGNKVCYKTTTTYDIRYYNEYTIVHLVWTRLPSGVSMQFPLGYGYIYLKIKLPPNINPYRVS